VDIPTAEEFTTIGITTTAATTNAADKINVVGITANK
jgi:hypothetical protein